MLFSIAVSTAVLFQVARVLPPSPPGTVGPLVASPSVIPIGTRTEVLFTCPITGAATLPGTTLLRKVDAYGTPSESLGQLNDAGVGGDVAAGDGVFSLRLPFTPDRDGDTRVVAATVFANPKVRVFSNDVTVMAVTPQARIGPAGGRVGIFDQQSSVFGATLSIPPGALGSTFDVAIAGPPISSGPDAGLRSLSLEPSGLSLSSPATLVVPIAGPGVVLAALHSPFNLQVDHGTELSRWQGLAVTVLPDGRASVSVPHFSTVTLGAALRVQTVLHLPGEYLGEGDLVFALTRLAGASTEEPFEWMPGHAALYLGTAVATTDPRPNDGETIVESTHANGGGVRAAERLTPRSSAATRRLAAAPSMPASAASA